MDAQTFILFGATGDLSRRKIVPALYNLYVGGKMPEQFHVVGAARSKFDMAEYQAFVRDALVEFSRRPVQDEKAHEFLSKFSYVPFDAHNDADYAKLLDAVQSAEAGGALPENRLFYLAVAPEFFDLIAMKLKDAGLTKVNGWKRLVVEKPFGNDWASASELNSHIATAFEENEVFRIDHYLGKEMVQNIELIRFANSIFEPLWNNRYVANVQITSSETVGVEKRASYYEKAGTLRDMVQNHMMQMLMMIAMEPPSRLNTEAIRDEKVKVLRSLRRYQDPQEIVKNVVRGQYLSGKANGNDVVGYLNEPGVSPTSATETFVAARLFVDNFRWAGVPFYIRSGKRMSQKNTQIVIEFTSMPERLYFNRDNDLPSNLLTIRISPTQGISLSINMENDNEEVGPNEIDFIRETKNSPEAYERLLYDAMTNDSTFFTRWDEVSLAWKWVDPVSKSFHHGHPLYPYVAGSNGPGAADELLATDGFRWWH